MFWSIKGEITCFLGFLFIPGFYHSLIHACTLDSSCFPVNLEIGDFIFLLILLSCISALIYKEERGGREGKQESNSRSRNVSCS